MNLLNALVASLSMSEKVNISLEVVLTGFVVVFAVLILLIFIIMIFSAIMTRATKNGNNADKKKQKNDTVSSAAVSKTTTARVMQSRQDGISEEVIAVISAAVATMYGPTVKTRIKSIKKSDGVRSAWANAGILENTRPFF